MSASVLFIVVSIGLFACAADANPPAAAAHDCHLLLDRRLIAEAKNARLAVGQLQKHVDNPLFGQELPWERKIHHMYANVVYDSDEQTYKLWYFTTISGPPGQEDWGRHVTAGKEAQPDAPFSGNLATCYAVSKDGVHWEKPALDVYRYHDKPTNIVIWGTHGMGIFKDRHDSDPTRRFKSVAGRFPHGTLDAAFSRDGIHWEKPFAIGAVRGDTHNNALWVPELKKYVAFTREYPPPGIRTVMRMESADFINWSPPTEVLRGPNHAQTYSMPVFRYGNVYLSLPAIYHLRGPLTGRVTTELAWSPDTRKWHRIDEGAPFIPVSDRRGDTDWGCVYAAASPVVRDTEIRVYYSGQKEVHGWNDGWFCVGTLRQDRWAGYVPREKSTPGVIVTHPVICNGSRLWLTADVATGGAVRCTVLDEKGRIIAKGTTLHSNSTRAVVAHLERHRHRRVRLRLEFQEAQVYSFGFRADPT